MNAIVSTILWLSVQIALFSAFGFAAFVLLRRRGPSAAAACCGLVLALTLPLAAMMVSPWPRWSIGAASKTAVSNHALNRGGVVQSNTADGDQNHDFPSLANSDTSDDSISTFSIWWTAAVDWVRNGGQANSVDVENRLTWQTYLPWLITAGVGFCLLRTVAGLWAMSRLRRSSRPIDDPALRSTLLQVVEMFDGAGSPANLHRSVGPGAKLQALELRETAALRSAATIGWRRPVLLLPDDWRTWTETERRVVLAHELAHVARRDYLTAVVARLATSIHFYQPLVLWLARQLRVQQELAADSWAAALAGGRQTYLATLAQMALCADEKMLPWAARAFLPGTSMLIKRVAWLKQKGIQKEMTMNRNPRWFLALAMAAIAFCISGIRGPAMPDAARAQSPPAQPKIGVGTLTLAKALHTAEFIPADATVVIVASPAELAKTPAVAKLISAADEQGFEQKFRLKLEDLADVQAVISKNSPLVEKLNTSKFSRVIIRAVKPYDWKRTVVRLSEGGNGKPATKQFEGKDYFVVDPSQCAYIPDDRTLILGPEEEIQKIIHGGEKMMSQEAFGLLGSSELGIRADVPSLAAMIGLDKGPVEVQEKMALVKPLLDEVKVATLGGVVVPGAGDAETMTLALTAQCASEEGTKRVEATLNAVRALAQNLLAAQAKIQTTAGQNVPPEAKLKFDVLKTLAAMAQAALENSRIHSGGEWLNAESTFKLPTGAALALVQPAIQSAREAAMRAQSMNNLKQLALACHMYLSINKHFPPAAIRDKDGKPLLSWRVAILPFIEEKPLYDQFHLDEPWDSEHNKALIAKMPTALRDPHDDATSSNASYFIPAGPGTIGGNPKGTSIKDITDGTSRTIMLVDAKRDIPWTKPEDIEIDPDTTKPLPKFGGHMPDGLFATAFADGSVHVFSQGAVDSSLLRAMLTIAGAEIIDINAFEAGGAPQAAASPPAENRGADLVPGAPLKP